MFRKRSIIIAENTETVLRRLEQQKRCSFLSDSVGSEWFLIHRSLTNSRRDNPLNFVFRGSVHICDEGTQISYCIRPSALGLVTLVVLLAVFLSCFVSALFVGKGFWEVVGALMMNAAIYAGMQWQASVCCRQFESKLM